MPNHAINVRSIETRWPEFSRTVFVPHTEQEYQHLVAILDDLIDEVGENEQHPLASLMEVIGALVERYEDENISEAIPGA